MNALDYFGKDAAPLRRKRLFLFDLDGTLYNGGRVFPGTLPLLSHIRETGGRAVYVTNNSSRSVRDCAGHLRALGIPAAEADFCTAAQTAARLLAAQYPGELVFCVGTGSLVAELRRSGIPVTTQYDPGAGVVLIGYDTELRYQKLIDASRLLLEKNAVYLATNPDWVCPAPFGAVPDCGSICKMLEYAVHRWPRFLGKPEPDMILTACGTAGVPPAEAVVLGDRLYTDIAAGVRAGVDTVCVLSGESTEQMVRESAVQPDYTFLSVLELLRCLEKEEEMV
ncbi:MAG: HAD-IIA family hydrolase [Oscillospiraceae bacterium]|nr:HAD-IIA family hydrolase [Oscillospiraceae bacterium]